MWIQFPKPALIIKRTYGGRSGVENYYSVCRIHTEPIEVISLVTDEDTLCCDVEIKTSRVSEGYRVSYVNVANSLFRILE
jgi:hypothetical protein